MTLRISEKGSPISLSQTSSLRSILRPLWRQRIVALKAIALLYIAVSLVMFTARILGCLGPPPLDESNFDGRRTWDTNGTSPLNELDNYSRFYKMHSKMSNVFINNVKQYHKRASYEPNKDDITVTAFVTENRFDDLRRLAELWQGPIAATFHISSASLDENDPIVQHAFDNLNYYLNQHPIIAKYADIHVVASILSYEQPEMLARPTNFHLNVARFFARTDFIFYLDHDTWPTVRTREEIRRHRKLLLNDDVISVPTFAYKPAATNLRMPRTREDVISLVRSGDLGLQDDGWELNRGPTCYASWQKGKVYKIEDFEVHYRPNFVSKRNGTIPWCTERFDDNKAACLYQAYITGSDIWVLPETFLIRRNFNPKSHLLKPSESKWAKAINSRLYTKFYREACVHYARQFIFEGKWDSPRAVHLKQECNRVLTNWGKGLVDA
ncbi:9635_t:CDS:2 [Paraglomus occultum]|uniref:9635_t:CDS:1 n=1 Tax=Paraglomus occultum TaxID=144539 RepID=A0A9N8ZGR0_9GLOM|nr:9635_t:CDS:2 [Paraglomus occultum]